MDYPKFIVSNQKDESISIQRFKTNLGDNCIQNFQLGRLIIDLGVCKFSLTTAISVKMKTSFATVNMMLNEHFEYIYPYSNTFLQLLYPATLKSAGYYVIPSIQKICPSVRPSFCMSVCMSVCGYVCPSAHHFHSLLGAFFNQFS